jgi:hypothetical protein
MLKEGVLTMRCVKALESEKLYYIVGKINLKLTRTPPIPQIPPFFIKFFAHNKWSAIDAHPTQKSDQPPIVAGQKLRSDPQRGLK